MMKPLQQQLQARIVSILLLVLLCASTTRTIHAVSTEATASSASSTPATTMSTGSQSSSSSSSSLHSFGKSLRHSQFRLNYTNFNHGSFGACPNFVLEYQASLQLEQEQQPDIWLRTRHYQLQNRTRAKLTNYVGAPNGNENQDGMLLVESASTAVNAIMRSFPWQQGDILLLFSVAYPMVHHTAQWLQHRFQIQIEIMPISFPIPTTSQQQQQPSNIFIDALQTKLIDIPKDQLKMIVLDHIVSIPAIKEPVAELAAMIKAFQPNCFVLVDGAHAIGQILNLNLQAIGNIDAYLSNGHKWLYSPKGSAFLWINTTSGFVTDTFPEPTVISSSNAIGATSLIQRFAYVSTREYTAWVSIDAALDFRQTILGGDDAIYQYCRTLALQAKHFLIQLWNVTPLAPDDMEEFMINLPVPIPPDQALSLQQYLLYQHGMYIVLATEPTSGIVYTRLSAQVYLELWDFHHLGHLVQSFIHASTGNTTTTTTTNNTTTITTTINVS